MIGKTTITHCRPTNGIVRKSHRTITVTNHHEDHLSKAASSFFLTKTISKLERAPSTKHQNIDRTQKQGLESACIYDVSPCHWPLLASFSGINQHILAYFGISKKYFLTDINLVNCPELIEKDCKKHFFNHV